MKHIKNFSSINEALNMDQSSDIYNPGLVYVKLNDNAVILHKLDKNEDSSLIYHVFNSSIGEATLDTLYLGVKTKYSVVYGYADDPEASEYYIYENTNVLEPQKYTNMKILKCTINNGNLIDHGTFYEYHYLNEVHMSNSITTIWPAAFYDCASLSIISLSSSLTLIMDLAFYDCFNLTSIILPNSLDCIKLQAFSNCGLQSLILPNSLTSMASAFENCWALTSVVIPANINEWGFAFYNCTSLSDVSILTNTIASNAFENCTSLTSITLPSNLTYIGGSAFNGANIQELKFNGTVARFNEIKYSFNVNWSSGILTDKVICIDGEADIY